jgi:hypothetical protein
MPELYKYSYRVLSLDLTPGLTDFELPIDAEKIVYASPTDGPEITIRLQSKSNDGIPLRPQGEIVAPFQRVYITAAAVAKTIKLLIGSPFTIQLTGRDISVSGIITAKTEERYYADLGQMYDCELGGGASAGVVTACAIWNPSTTKKLIVKEIELGYTGLPAQNYFMYYITTIAGYGGYGVSAQNYDVQGASSLAFPVQLQSAAPRQTTKEFCQQVVPAGGRFRRENLNIILGPNEGLEVSSTTVNLGAAGYAKYIEAPL